MSEATRNKLSELLSGPLNPYYGKTHTSETKLNMRQLKLGENNPMFGKEKITRIYPTSIKG